MSYIGRGVDAISNVEKLDNITFDGSATYALTKSSAAFTPVGANNILISIDGVVQMGNFSVSTTNIVLDWSPTSSNTCNWILHFGTGVLNVPADSSVTQGKLGGEAVNEAKIQISNAGSNGQFLSKQSGNTGGLTWAAAGGDLSFGGDTFGADKTIGSNDAYALNIETNNTVAMKFDTSGRVTRPLQPMARVYLSGHQSVNNETWTKVAFDTEHSDYGSNFASNKFTCPVAGRYLVCAHLMFASIGDGDRVLVRINKNGSAWFYTSVTSGGAAYYSAYISDIAHYAASDYIEIYAYHDYGSARDVQGTATESASWACFYLL